jgi:hypothetical protein
MFKENNADRMRSLMAMEHESMVKADFNHDRALGLLQRKITMDSRFDGYDSGRPRLCTIIPGARR